MPKPPPIRYKREEIDSDTYAMAFAMYVFEDIEPGEKYDVKKWMKSWDSTWLQEEHHGDCIKQCCTCCVCLRESMVDEAKLIMAAFDAAKEEECSKNQ